MEDADTPLSLGDRLKYGAIGAGFGALMGVALLFVVMFGFGLAVKASDILGFSAIYFGVVGSIVGAFVGDLVAASVGGLLDILAFRQYPPPDHRPPFTNERTFRPAWIFFAFVGWLFAGWLIYLRG